MSLRARCSEDYYETVSSLYIREAPHRNLQSLLQHAQDLCKPRLCKIEHREGN